MLQKASPAHEDVKYSTYGQGISCTTASRSSAPTLVRECSRPREHARVETIFLHLPVELARIVFLFCLPDAPFVTHHRREAPLNISGVCRFWRAVALATPELWSSLRPCMTSRESMRTAADTIGSWLSRCAPHPFRLALSFDKVDPPSECGLEIIAPTYSLGHVEGLAARLSSFLLSLRAEDLEGAREQLRFLDGDAERLERLSITACSSPASSFTSPPLSKLQTFRSMPRLRSFTLRTDVAFRASSFDVPWAQLTELTLCRHTPAFPLHSRWTKTHNADVLAVLRACPRLVSCTVYLHADSDALRTPAPTVHLPHLQTLRLDVDAVLGASSAATVDGAVFGALRAPALEALRVCGPVSGARGVAWPAAEFAALLARCAGSLREVALERVPLGERELRGIRESVRVVVELCGRSD